MPLTDKGQKILANMEKEYGADKAKRVLYASKNAGTISGIDACEAYDDADVEAAAAFMDELRGKGRGDSIGAKLDAACAKLDACVRGDAGSSYVQFKEGSEWKTYRRYSSREEAEREAAAMKAKPNFRDLEIRVYPPS